MLHQKDLKLFFLLFRKLRFIYFFPLIFIYLAVPAWEVIDLYIVHLDPDMIYQNFVFRTQVFFPFLSVIWPAALLRNFIEEEGNELLFFYEKRNKLFDLCGCLILYVFHLLPPFLWGCYYFHTAHVLLDFLRVISECVFYTGLTYAALFTMQSLIPAMILPTLLFLIPMKGFLSERPANLFFINMEASASRLLVTALLVSLAGVLLAMIGSAAATKKIRYR